MTDTWDLERASCFLQENFAPSDRLALVLINRRTGGVIQRLAPAKIMEAPDFLHWAAEYNRRHFDVYVSMNALKSEAAGRTKEDVGTIRHVYLDFDEEAPARLREMFETPRVPKPNELVHTSAEKWQVIWRVKDFGKLEAEALQRSLVRRFGADPAATDCARVLRLPAFFNHKYAPPHLVTVETLAGDVLTPDRFPDLPEMDIDAGYSSASGIKRKEGPISQSEKDWAYAKRAIARGESPDMVAAAIAAYRRYDKHDPVYYARLTVQKAMQALEREHHTPSETQSRS